MSKKAFAHLPTLTLSLAVLAATPFEPKEGKPGNAKLMLKLVKANGTSLQPAQQVLVEKYVSLDELATLQKAGLYPGAMVTVTAKGINSASPRRIPATDKYPESIAYSFLGFEKLEVTRGFVPLDLDAVASAPVAAPLDLGIALDQTAAQPVETPAEPKGWKNQLASWITGNK